MKKPPSFLIFSLLVLSIGSGCSSQSTVYQPAVAKLIESARTLKDSSQTDAAVCRLESAADIAPDSYQVQYDLGILYSDANQLPHAVEHLKKAADLAPDKPNTFFTLGDTEENLGDLYAEVANAPGPKTLQDPRLPADMKKLSKPDATAKSKAAYQDALDAYQKFLQAAPSSDPGRKEVEGQIAALQAKLKH
jgi:tetratricopeptide (TPR) repeat protein